jgi:hypothetical protein
MRRSLYEDLTDQGKWHAKYGSKKGESVMYKATASQLADTIALNELGIVAEGGMWTEDDVNGDDIWCPDYTEEQCEQVERVAQHITKIFNETDWQKIANKED